MRNLPKVSIIIPTYNRANYLPQAIESALAQDYPNLEVVVSDNCSTDETPEVVKKYMNDKRFKYFRNKENIGMVKNWRKAVFEYATGDWFIILSDDDYFIDKSYVLKAIALTFEKKYNIVMVYANGYILNEKKKEYKKLELPFDKIEEGKKIFLLRGKINPQDFILCNVMFKRDLAIKLNAFSNEKNLSCDSELFLKMCLLGNVGVITDFVSIYRVHNNNTLYTIRTYADFLINNLDHLLEPYIFAKENKLLSEQDLSLWLKEVVFRKVMETAIWLNVFEKKNFSSLETLIYNKLGISLDEIFHHCDIDIKMKFILSRKRRIYLFLKNIKNYLYWLFREI